MTTKERAEKLVAEWEDSPPATHRSLARLVQKALDDERLAVLHRVWESGRPGYILAEIIAGELDVDLDTKTAV